MTTTQLYDLIDACDDGDQDALIQLEAVADQISHEPLCPQRVGGECECVVAQVRLSVEAFDDLTPEDK